MSSTPNIGVGRDSSGIAYLNATFIAAPGTTDQAYLSPASGCLFFPLGEASGNRYRGVEIQLASNAAENATMSGIECGLVYRHANESPGDVGRPFTSAQYASVITSITGTVGTTQVLAATVTNLGLSGSYYYCDTLTGTASAFATTRLDGESGLATGVYSPADNTRAAIIIPYTADAAGVYIYGGGDLAAAKTLVAFVRPYGGAF